MVNRETLKVGLVELHVAPRDGAPNNRFDAVRGAAERARRERLETVLGVLERRDTRALDLVVFPGWTVVGRTLPKAVLRASGKRVVVVEGLEPDARTKRKSALGYGWTTYVVWRGEIVARARQLFTRSSEASDARAAVLARELEGERVFSHPKLGRTALLVCGEPNVVPEHGPTRVPLFDTVLNPAHTPSTLPAMHRKRARLAERGLLFSTANTHDGWSSRDGTMRASPRAAEWFRLGKREARPDAIDVGPNARVSIVELAARHAQRSARATS